MKTCELIKVVHVCCKSRPGGSAKDKKERKNLKYFLSALILAH